MRRVIVQVAGRRCNRLPQASYRQTRPAFALRELCSTSAATEEEEKVEQDPREKIMEFALNHVNRRGWTVDALSAGAVDAGFPPVVHGLFPRGAAELAEFWMKRGNDNLEGFLSAYEKPAKQEDKEGGEAHNAAEELVVSGLMVRLEHNIPYLRSWPQAMALGLYPENLPFTLKLLQQIPKLICDHANMTGETTEWDKRVNGIGAVYAASELYMLTDYSEGYKDTNAFVKGRLRDSLILEQKGGPSADTLSAVVNGVGSILTASASMVSPLIPKPPGFHPPNPEDFRMHVTKAAETVQSIINSASPKDRTAEAPSTSPESTPDTTESKSSEESKQQQDIVDPIRLPSGMSTFGLLHMSSKEAVDIIQQENPDFVVDVSDLDSERMPKTGERRFVRLIVDPNDVVVDVLRS